MQQQQSLLEGKLTRPPAPPKPERIKTQTVTLIGSNGAKWDAIELRADKNLPQTVLWGVADHQRVFLRDGSSRNYKETSWVRAAMPEFIPL